MLISHSQAIPEFDYLEEHTLRQWRNCKGNEINPCKYISVSTLTITVRTMTKSRYMCMLSLYGIQEQAQYIFYLMEISESTCCLMVMIQVIY